MKARILVTSAAGNTGIPTTLGLLEKGYKVRAFVRQRDARSLRLEEAGAELFVGDMFSYRDMRNALKEVQRAYVCPPPGPNTAHFASVFVTAARESQLEHVVTLSQWLSAHDHLASTTREAWLLDKMIAALPNTTHTINEVGFFAENYFGGLAAAAQLGMLAMPLGSPELKGNAPPSNEDIAAVSVACLADPKTHAGHRYRPTGPTLLSNNEIAGIIGKALGRTVTYTDAPEWMFLKAMKADGINPTMMTQFRLYMHEYQRGTFAVNAPNDVVRTVTGQEPESFETIAKRVVHNNPEAVRSARNWITTVTGMLRILLTSTPSVPAIEQAGDHVLITDGVYANGSEDWASLHSPT
ncbi:hypothetical protein A9Q74_06920 [Colwellia sp. 39_35_sub15_T18]|nr:hypothetical protein A9Q74_06920 [Colwellia sp. 39_35_sub15_T18]